MRRLTNTNAKTPYDFDLYYAEEVTVDKLVEILNAKYVKHKKGVGLSKAIKKFKFGSGKHCKSFVDICCGFDLEAKTLYAEGLAFKYAWMWSIEQTVILGATDEELLAFVDMLEKAMNLSSNQRLLVWVYNLSYEFQWVRKLFNIDDANENFFKDERHPLFFTHNHRIVFQDAAAIVGGGLKKLADGFTNTQKCVGDLDYDADWTMDSYKSFTDEELMYCCNDVLILSEWARYYADTYLVMEERPLTTTAILYNEVKRNFNYYCFERKIDKEAMMEYIRTLQCDTPEEYATYMSFLYRGGYNHANYMYSDRLFLGDEAESIKGVDFTSSYPASALLGYDAFPISHFDYIDVKTIDEIKALMKDYCLIFDIEFDGVRSTTSHSLESHHKCLELEGAELDNGRVRKCKHMRVILTELDFESYLEFYKWKSYKITWCRIAEKGALPEYLLTPMIKYYVGKAERKEAGLPYAFEKIMVNIFYGMCVKRDNAEKTLYCGESWTTEEGEDYYKQMRKKLLSPFYGIYISALSRRNLLKVTYKLEKAGKTVLYMDTDSLKIYRYDDICDKIISDYNDDIDKRIDFVCDEYDIEKKYIHDLGMFDKEYGYDNKVVAFKMLGCKRYMISAEKDGKIKHNQTIAGLPKNRLFKGREDWLNVYKEFDDNMNVTECKLTPKYLDDEYYIESMGLTVKSGIALMKTDFSMSLDDEYIQLLANRWAETENLEFRID